MGQKRENNQWKKWFTNELYQLYDDPDMGITAGQLRAGHLVRMDNERAEY
jgi:hypothetical protein